MRRGHLGFLLIVMMLGHNYVLNQTQSMQKPLCELHDITVTEFNLLYSVPSAVSILFIIPMGFFYERLANSLLWTGAITLSLGQLLVGVFGGEGQTPHFQLLMGGRIFEGIGAEVLYMIQGNMASSWMGKYAGLVFILPELGEILNVFATPWTYTHFGITISFLVGFLVCLLSSAAALAIYFGLVRHRRPSAKDDEDEGRVSGFIDDNKHTEMRVMVATSPLKEEEAEMQLGDHEPKSLFQAGRITWLVLLLCGINECLYFPFLDNANQLVTNRFCIPYEETGFYLAVPFVSAMLTSALSSWLLPQIERCRLILYVSVIPLIGHALIFFDVNCDSEPTFIVKAVLVLGLAFFGMGIGTYYSVSFPAVGLSVPSSIRGMAYACMAFFQTISMTLIPILTGMIIQTEEKITKLSEGYREESLLFVAMCLAGVVVSGLIYLWGGEHSFAYNDEHTLEEQDRLKDTSTSSTRSSATS